MPALTTLASSSTTSTVTAGGSGTVTINGTAGGVSTSNNWGVDVESAP